MTNHEKQAVANEFPHINPLEHLQIITKRRTCLGINVLRN